jgi:hypothetical protein
MQKHPVTRLGCMKDILAAHVLARGPSDDEWFPVDALS